MLVKDIVPGPASSSPYGLAAFPDYGVVLFSAFTLELATRRSASGRRCCASRPTS